ncbi:MAG: iron-sulfur cluster assembly scaffold protein [Clostridia bacterium]|jgi:nitrogen fixation NifU-like protein|nr:iron-sulfur cluster assembly scaffold protein [Clostridia bacterium]
MYNEKVMNHFENPRNVGEIPTANAVGEMESASCGDTTIIYLDIQDNIIKDIHFKTYGCAAAIASSSMLTEMVKGKTLEEAEAITTDAIVQELGGLPPAKIHCSVLAGDALKKAIANYKAEHKA